MINSIHNYLKVYVTENNIPLVQVLTERDLYQLSVTLAKITKDNSITAFKNTETDIFIPLSDGHKINLYRNIEEFLFVIPESPQEGVANILLLGYYCFMYLSVRYELPIEKSLFVVSQYMKNHIIEQADTHSIDCSNPISNLIRINDTQYVRTNGKQILPPSVSIKETFIKELTSLLTL